MAVSPIRNHPHLSECRDPHIKRRVCQSSSAVLSLHLSVRLELVWWTEAHATVFLPNGHRRCLGRSAGCCGDRGGRSDGGAARSSRAIAPRCRRDSNCRTMRLLRDVNPGRARCSSHSGRSCTSSPCPIFGRICSMFTLRRWRRSAVIAWSFPRGVDSLIVFFIG